MTPATTSLQRPSPKSRSQRVGAHVEGATVSAPATEAVAPPSQGLKPIGSTFANLAALYRAKAGE